MPTPKGQRTTPSFMISVLPSRDASALQGGTVIFTNVVRNTGNGIDTFDITMATGTFPGGSTFNLFQSDASTPLIDSTGNGVPDTGPLSPNQTYAVIVRVTL